MTKVTENTPINCAIELTVSCLDPLHSPVTFKVLFPYNAVKGHVLCDVGTALQRQVYEALRIAYSDYLSSTQDDKETA